MQVTRNLIGISLALFLASCPGDEQTKSDAALDLEGAGAEASAEVEETLKEVAGEIDAAAQEAAAKIDESNADDILEEMSKDIGEN